MHGVRQSIYVSYQRKQEAIYKDNATLFDEVAPHEINIGQIDTRDMERTSNLTHNLSPDLNYFHDIDFSADSVTHLNGHSGSLTVQGCIGGETLPCLIDTGAAITAISLALWQRLPAPVNHPPRSN